MPAFAERQLVGPRHQQTLTSRAYNIASVRRDVKAIEVREPIASLATDEDIVAAYRAHGQSMFHSTGTCRMGGDGAAVVDDRLRVRGVHRLRVADAAIMPAMPSCNTNGPAMAIGWRGAELILADRNR